MTKVEQLREELSIAEKEERHKKSVSRANTKWKKKALKRVEIAFRLDTESHLIEWLQEQPSMQSFIKDLIKKEYANTHEDNK